VEREAMTDEELCKLDLYLFIDVTPQATKAEIKKAFKVKARDVHPDKNPDPKAGELFAKLHTIYDFLRDDKKREMYDKMRQQQELRKRKLEEEDSGRKSLRKELERREEAYRKAKVQENNISEAEKARFQTAKMIAELTQTGVLNAAKGASVSTSSHSSHSFKSPSATASSSSSRSSGGCLFKAAPPNVGSTASATSSTTVVIAWEQKKVKEEWQVELRLMLEQYGRVGDLIVKKKKALAVFATASQAAAAVVANQTHPELKFKLKPMLVVEEEQVQAADPRKTEPAPQVILAPAHYADDYEAQTLQLLLRQQQKKQTL
jgi:curved DNA-binding protein CbpA